ncbi:MAG: leucine-rich repeat protein [Muribaculaceae bacterium]|nr:leucine-rich repeat protein [Muribaculaceae bacterium]
MKKFLSIVVMGIVAMHAWAAAGDVIVDGNYKYQIIKEAINISPGGSGSASVIGFSSTVTSADQANAVIAQVVKKDGFNYIVTEIAPNAFSGNTNITSVTIKGPVSKIGMAAFYGCSNLAKVSLGSVITTLDANAFANCTSLASVKIPDTLTGISTAAFDGCTALESFEVVESNPTYSSFDGALYNKKQTILMRMPAAKAEKPTYPITLKTIYARAYNCYKYPRIELPYGVTTVGSRPFENSEVQVVVVPSSVKTIPSDMYYGCSKLIELWSNMKYVPRIEKDVMFAGANIPNLYIPFGGMDNYTTYSNWDFFPNYNDRGLTAYDYIQAKDENGANACFNVTVHSTEPFTAVDGVTYDGRCMLVKGVNSRDKRDDITVPNYFEITGKRYALTKIQQYAGQSQYDFSMRGCALIDSIYMNAFYSSKISSFNFENVSYIGDETFLDCKQLKTVKFGPRIKFIRSSAFSRSGLEGDVVLPYGIGDFYPGAFSNTKIKRLLLPSSVFITGRFSYNYPELEELYLNCAAAVVSSLKNFSAGCKVYVPVGEVDAYRALDGADEKEILPGAFDFAECTSDDMTGFFDTPYAYTIVNNNAATVKLVRTKNTATASLTTFEVGDMCTNYSMAIAPEKAPSYKITELGDSLLYGCENYSNISLENATNLNKIGKRALANVRAITITIPANVTSIGDEAFSKERGRYQWRTIESKIADPRSVSYGKDIFKGVDYKNCKLIVPAGTEDIYRQCEPWAPFFENKPVVYKTGDVNADGNVDVSDLNVVLNIVLGKDDAAKYDGRADVNGDKNIDVSDLNKIINIILGKEVPEDTHEYVDLGLPDGVQWATCNVGASKPEEAGLYFAWGEIDGYAKDDNHTFDWAHYNLCNGFSSKMTKYSCSTAFWDRNLGTSPDNITVLEAKDDAATANWGAEWRMPSLQEMKDLYNSKYTRIEWVTVNGVYGCKITSNSNGNSIFLPAAGYRDQANLNSEGEYGYYWTSELNSGYCGRAYYLYFYSGLADCGNNNRTNGLNVRAVRK